MTHNKDIPLSLIARDYLITLLGTCTDADQQELAEVVVYLNNLISFDEINEQKIQ